MTDAQRENLRALLLAARYRGGALHVALAGSWAGGVAEKIVVDLDSALRELEETGNG